MLTLYYKPTCAFSRRVLAVTDRLGLEVETKDVTESEIQEELIKAGGKRQIPYLVDAEKGESMYESDDIVAYLQKTYGPQNTVTSRPRVHISDNACLSCEG